MKGMRSACFPSNGNPSDNHTLSACTCFSLFRSQNSLAEPKRSVVGNLDSLFFPTNHVRNSLNPMPSHSRALIPPRGIFVHLAE